MALCTQHLCHPCVRCEDGVVTDENWHILLSTQNLTGSDLIKHMYEFLQMFSDSPNLSLSDLNKYITLCSTRAVLEKPIYQVQRYNSMSYGEVLASLLSAMVDLELEKLSNLDGDADKEKGVASLCSRILLLLQDIDVEFIPEVMLGNTDNICDLHIKLYMHILAKLTGLTHSWSCVGYTKFMLLCKHTRKLVKRISVSKAEVQKLMIKIAVPADYVKFVKRFDRNIYELLKENKQRIGWVLYSEVDQETLFSLVENARQPAVESDVEEEGLVEEDVDSDTYEDVVITTDLSNHPALDDQNTADTFIIDREADNEAVQKTVNPAASFNNPTNSGDLLVNGDQPEIKTKNKKKRIKKDLISGVSDEDVTSGSQLPDDYNPVVDVVTSASGDSHVIIPTKKKKQEADLTNENEAAGGSESADEAGTKRRKRKRAKGKKNAAKPNQEEFDLEVKPQAIAEESSPINNGDKRRKKKRRRRRIASETEGGMSDEGGMPDNASGEPNGASPGVDNENLDNRMSEYEFSANVPVEGEIQPEEEPTLSFVKAEPLDSEAKMRRKKRKEQQTAVQQKLVFTVEEAEGEDVATNEEHPLEFNQSEDQSLAVKSPSIENFFTEKPQVGKWEIDDQEEPDSKDVSKNGESPKKFKSPLNSGSSKKSISPSKSSPYKTSVSPSKCDKTLIESPSKSVESEDTEGHSSLADSVSPSRHASRRKSPSKCAAETSPIKASNSPAVNTSINHGKPMIPKRNIMDESEGSEVEVPDDFEEENHYEKMEGSTERSEEEMEVGDIPTNATRRSYKLSKPLDKAAIAKSSAYLSSSSDGEEADTMEMDVAPLIPSPQRKRGSPMKASPQTSPKKSGRHSTGTRTDSESAKQVESPTGREIRRDLREVIPESAVGNPGVDDKCSVSVFSELDSMDVNTLLLSVPAKSTDTQQETEADIRNSMPEVMTISSSCETSPPSTPEKTTPTAKTPQSSSKSPLVTPWTLCKTPQSTTPRASCRSSEKATPQLGGTAKTPTSGRRRHRTLETRYDNGKERELDRLVEEHLKRKLVDRSNAKPIASTEMDHPEPSEDPSQDEEKTDLELGISSIPNTPIKAAQSPTKIAKSPLKTRSSPPKASKTPTKPEESPKATEGPTLTQASPTSQVDEMDKPSTSRRKSSRIASHCTQRPDVHSSPPTSTRSRSTRTSSRVAATPSDSHTEGASVAPKRARRQSQSEIEEEAEVTQVTKSKTEKRPTRRRAVVQTIDEEAEMLEISSSQPSTSGTQTSSHNRLRRSRRQSGTTESDTDSIANSESLKSSSRRSSRLSAAKPSQRQNDDSADSFYVSANEDLDSTLKSESAITSQTPRRSTRRRNDSTDSNTTTTSTYSLRDRKAIITPDRTVISSPLRSRRRR